MEQTTIFWKQSSHTHKFLHNLLAKSYLDYELSLDQLRFITAGYLAIKIIQVTIVLAILNEVIRLADIAYQTILGNFNTITP